MVDRLKEILQKVQEWWNKFTAKQKTIIIRSSLILTRHLYRRGET